MKHAKASKFGAVHSPKMKTPNQIGAEPKRKALKMAATTETFDEGEKPYEKVTPRDFFSDSWSNQVSRGRRWWGKKSRKKRKETWKTMLAVFTVIVVLVISLIVAGVVYIIRDSNDRRLADKLQTKTERCQQYQPSNRECYIENEESYSRCDVVKCDRVIWDFMQTNSTKDWLSHHEKPRANWEINIDPYAAVLHNTDFTECGYRKWCISGSCVDSGISKRRWWISKAPFSASTNEWTQKEGSFNCFRTDGGKELYLNMSAWYWNHCNKSTCDGNSFAKYGLYMKTRHCDMSPDHLTGVRRKKCDGSPLVLYHCGRCENYNSTLNVTHQYANFETNCLTKLNGTSAMISFDSCKILCKRNLNESALDRGFAADGTPCKSDSGRESVCFQGRCVEIIDDPTAIQSSE